MCRLSNVVWLGWNQSAPNQREAELSPRGARTEFWPALIQRVQRVVGSPHVEETAYAQSVAATPDPFATLEIPPGMMVTYGRGPDLSGTVKVVSDEWLRAHLVPGLTLDPEEGARRIGELAGSVSIGRRPVKADYRARWRYNSEEFDANGDPL